MIDLITAADGTRYAGFPQDHLFNLLRNGDTFPDRYVKDAIDAHVKPESICVDVGANLGYVSLYLAARAKWVHSFEPQPNVFLQLCANLFLNQRLNVTPYNMGVFSRETTLDFADYQSGWVGTNDFSDYEKIRSIGSISLQERSGGKIPARALDSIFATDQKIDFIKIDAQGADIDVLIGAERILAQHHPVVIFEYEDDLSRQNYGRSLEDFFGMFDDSGYKITEVYPGNYLLT
jgi:FkbM family methyltransferase